MLVGVFNPLPGTALLVWWGYGHLGEWVLPDFSRTQRGGLVFYLRGFTSLQELGCSVVKGNSYWQYTYYMGF